MVKELYDSFKDNVKERTTNPFLGTLAIVWLIKNWVLVYSLFYFDAKLTLDKRLAYIEAYFDLQSFWLNLSIVVGITVVLLILTYLFLAISRLIANFNDTTVVPWIYKITDKSSVVKKTEYILLLEKVRELEQRVETERIAKISAFQERDQLELRLLENGKQVKIPEEPDDSISQYLKIIKTTPQDQLDKIIVAIRRMAYFSNKSEGIMELLKHGFVKANSTHSDSTRYEFTEEGDRFVKWLNNYTPPEGS